MSGANVNLHDLAEENKILKEKEEDLRKVCQSLSNAQALTATENLELKMQVEDSRHDAVELEKIIKVIKELTHDCIEINPQNYNHEEVIILNEFMIKIHNVIKESLEARSSLDKSNNT